ncbi:MAG: hypothetical protein JXK07_07530 [Spirochaetes bacterium]|nr:hypothetical protein [Spirochaetota bacterium]MBN2769705.1 hypothetical protein [Spirochaetota bacterium]
MTSDMVNVLNRISELQKRFGIKRQQVSDKVFRDNITKNNDSFNSDVTAVKTSGTVSKINAQNDVLIKNIIGEDYNSRFQNNNINFLDSTVEPDDAGIFLNNRDMIINKAVKAYKKQNSSETNSGNVMEME